MTDVYKLLEQGKETVALRVQNTCSQGDEFAHITLQVVYLKHEEYGNPSGFDFYDNYYDQKNQYKGLILTGQMDCRNAEPYAWEIGIQNFSSTTQTLEMVEKQVKTLRPIMRKLEKMNETEGSPSSFEEYVIRFAKAIKAKGYFSKKNRFEREPYNAQIGHLRSHIRSLIEENNKVMRFVREEVA